MKKALIILPLLAMVFGLYKMYQGAQHAHHGAHTEHAMVDVTDHKAVQRGAGLFVNYCMGCHSAEHVRYKQLTAVGLTEQEILDNLMFGGGKIGDQMEIAMPARDASAWFGGPAPDASLLARKRGNDWVYTYLKSFYRDASRPKGVNNTVFPNVGMPHVLEGLQGVQEAVYRYDVSHDGHVEKTFASQADADAYVQEKGDGYSMEKHVDKLKLAKPGSMNAEEYDRAVRDITTFMAYIAEPVQSERKSLGVWVLLFLVIFTALAYALKKEFWRDVH